MAEYLFDKHKRPLDTLHLHPQQQRALIDEINNRDGDANLGIERRQPRYQFNTNREICVQIRHPNGAEAAYQMLPRNLNARGVGLVLGVFLYPNTVCAVMLPTLDQEMLTVHGKVAHCHHVTGMIHEVGITFDRPIDVTNFIADLQEEIVLEGRALIVDEYQADRLLVTHLLTELGLTAAGVATTAELTDSMRSSPSDLVLISADMLIPPAQLIQAARQINPQIPLLAMSADDAQSPRLQVLKMEVESLLSRPLDQAQLTRAVQAALRQKPAPILSTIDRDEKMFPLIEMFVDQTREQAAELETAIDNADIEFITRMLRNLKGGGRSFGFEVVTRLALSALNHVTGPTTTLDDARTTLRELISVMKRIAPARLR